MLGPHTTMVIFKLLVGVKWGSYEIAGDLVQLYPSVQKGQLSVWTTIPGRRDRHETPTAARNS